MASLPRLKDRRQPIPEIHNGDRMSQPEFHRLYEQMPEDFRAELIGGIVHVPSPLRRPHSSAHGYLGALLVAYEGHTPGVEAGNNATIILGEEGEPQPDLYLRILTECGGQSEVTADDYVQGAPEFLAEIAHSSQAVDLNAKKGDYARYGVLEYLVLSLKERRLHWFDLRAGKERKAGRDGIYRIHTFPGLWIDGPALLGKDYQKMMTTLDQGLATPEHAAFAMRLAQTRH
jgi:Uma2 family endonuclease